MVETNTVEKPTKHPPMKSEPIEDRSTEQRPVEDETPEYRPSGKSYYKQTAVEEPVEQVRPSELQAPTETPRYDPVYGEGLIEVSGKGFGFLRDPRRNYAQSPHDMFVAPEVVRKHALRDGLWIKGEIRRGSRGSQLFKLTEINGENPDRDRNLPVFEKLTSIQ